MVKKRARKQRGEQAEEVKVKVEVNEELDDDGKEDAAPACKAKRRKGPDDVGPPWGQRDGATGARGRLGGARCRLHPLLVLLSPGLGAGRGTRPLVATRPRHVS